MRDFHWNLLQWFSCSRILPWLEHFLLFYWYLGLRHLMMHYQSSPGWRCDDCTIFHMLVQYLVIMYNLWSTIPSIWDCMGFNNSSRLLSRCKILTFIVATFVYCLQINNLPLALLLSCTTFPFGFERAVIGLWVTRLCSAARTKTTRAAHKSIGFGVLHICFGCWIYLGIATSLDSSWFSTN